MSHRVTTQTEIKDKTCAIKALEMAKFSFTESGDTLHVTSGPMNRATINLRTGEIVGDTDVHRKGDESLGALKKFYAEQKFMQECVKQGITVQERSLDQKTGDIVLRCHGHFA